MAIDAHNHRDFLPQKMLNIVGFLFLFFFLFLLFSGDMVVNT